MATISGPFLEHLEAQCSETPDSDKRGLRPVVVFLSEADLAFLEMRTRELAATKELLTGVQEVAPPSFSKVLRLLVRRWREEVQL